MPRYTEGEDEEDTLRQAARDPLFYQDWKQKKRTRRNPMRKMNLSAVLAAIKSPKTPAGLKKGLIKKYGAQLQGYKLPMSALATTVQANPKRSFKAGDLVIAMSYGRQEKYKVLGIGKRVVWVKNLSTGLRSWKHPESLTKVDTTYRNPATKYDIIVTETSPDVFEVVYPAKKYIGTFNALNKVKSFLRIAEATGLKIKWELLKGNPVKKRKPRSPYDVVGEVYSGNPKHRFREGDIIALKKQPNSLHMIVGMGKYSYKLQSQKGMKWAAQYEVADKLFKLVDRDRG